MSEEKDLLIVKCVIRYDSADGKTWQEVSAILPLSVASNLSCALIDWQERCTGTVKEISEVLEAIEKFKDTKNN